MNYLILLVVTLLFIYSIITNKKRKYLKEFPEPPKNFLFGQCLDIRNMTNVLNTMTRYFTYGSTIRGTFGPSFAPIRVALLTSDYTFMEYLLGGNKVLTKTENYFYLKPWLGTGLLISDGAKWKKHRKIITPAFHFEILKQFVGVFERVADVFVDKLKEFNNNSSVDLYPLVTLCTLDIICESAMGTKINAQQGENLEYVRCVRDMCRIVIGRCLSPLKILKQTFWLTRDFYVQKKLVRILHNFTTSVINSKKVKVKDKKIDNSENEKKVALLDLLLKFSENGNLITYDEIREEVDTFMFAGHDTTASAICFTFYCLASHPKIQEKVFQEQKELFGEEKNPSISYQDLQNMRYLEMVIKESLRLYPPVPIIGRYTTEDIQFNDCLIPKETNIVISIFHMHRNPKYFKNPEIFDPSRFENFHTFYPYSYVPFSAGSRNCIGQKFALLEMKSVISKVIRNYELSRADPSHQLVLSVETVLKSTSGVKIGLKLR